MSSLEDIVQDQLADYDPDGLRALIERVSQIQEMKAHPGWAFYCDLVFAETATRQRVILAGRLAPEEYNRQTGWVAGALAALEAPQKLQDTLESRRVLLEEEETSPNERSQ